MDGGGEHGVRFRLPWDDNEGDKDIRPPRLLGICESCITSLMEATDKQRAIFLIYFNVTTLGG